MDKDKLIGKVKEILSTNGLFTCRDGREYFEMGENSFDHVAEEIGELCEEVRKERTKEILADLKGLLEGYAHTKDNINLYEFCCRKYGVEVEE